MNGLWPAPTRRAVLACGALGGTLGAGPARSAPRTVLHVATWPGLDAVAKAVLPQWRQRHPDVDVTILSRESDDHHTAMITALSTASLLPDVVALAADSLGRFSRGNGLEDLAREPWRIDRLRLRPRLVPCAYDQAVAGNGAVVAMPADIGPGTMLHRADVLARAGVVEEALTASWDSYLQAGVRIKAATGAYLVAGVGQIANIAIRTGLKPSEGLYFGQASRVLVTSERFVRAFDIARRARQLKLDARVSAWSNEWVGALKRGSLATALTGAWFVGSLGNWVAPQTRGLWRAAQLPAGGHVAYGGAPHWRHPCAQAGRFCRQGGGH